MLEKNEIVIYLSHYKDRTKGINLPNFKATVEIKHRKISDLINVIFEKSQIPRLKGQHLLVIIVQPKKRSKTLTGC